MRKRNYTIDTVAIVIYIVRVFEKKRKLLPFMYTTSQIKILLNYGDRIAYTYYVIHELSLYNRRDMHLLQHPSHINFKREQEEIEIHY